MIPEQKNRNGLIGKIHVAKKQLALTDESYRDILRRLTGLESLKAMNVYALEKVLEEFKRLGFKPKGGKRAGERRRHADTLQASKIRALWLDLFHLGEVYDPAEEAIDAFVKKICGVRTMQWMDTTRADQVIRALRGWLGRTGFKVPTGADTQGIIVLRWNSGLNDAAHDLQGVAWKVMMICRQMELLSIEETDDNAPHRIAATYLDEVIEGYGRAIRGMKAARGQRDV